mmetsp:Transcript_10874/g.32182  ORF Transcript_10874/g.32182 Transcript_10874/m.32182 type:complete len:97 (+) Transcript_10874:1334-1624(+)
MWDYPYRPCAAQDSFKEKESAFSIVSNGHEQYFTYTEFHFKIIRTSFLHHMLACIPVISNISLCFLLITPTSSTPKSAAALWVMTMIVLHHSFRIS